jgi:hypothetical protein
MNGLRELQRNFARAVLEDDTRVAGRIRPNGMDPVQRLSIYRNNTLSGLAEALRDGYPVVHRLVGQGFFDGLARAYIVRHPPRTGCLLGYGDRFAAFVAEYPPAQGLPYLPDVAMLEWLWQQAFHEADGDGSNLSTLGGVATECYAELRFRLHPTARLMASDYPVLRIWEVNQPGFTGADRVSLDEGGSRLLVFRPGLEVEIHRLDAGNHAFLAALAGDSTITQALERAANADDCFDLLTSLRHWLERGLFTGFSL